MALEPDRAIRLARTLRELRESAWPDVELTQAQLAKALSAESRVASATLSSWESLTNPKTPTASRLSAYARFFATRRSLIRSRTSFPRRTSPPTSSSATASWRQSWSGCWPTRPAAAALSRSTRARSRSSARRHRPTNEDSLPSPATPTSIGFSSSPTKMPCWRCGDTSAPRTRRSRPDPHPAAVRGRCRRPVRPRHPARRHRLEQAGPPLPDRDRRGADHAGVRRHTRHGRDLQSQGRRRRAPVLAGMGRSGGRRPGAHRRRRAHRPPAQPLPEQPDADDLQRHPQPRRVRRGSVPHRRIGPGGE